MSNEGAQSKKDKDMGDALQSIFGALIGSFDAENTKAYEAFSQTPQAQAAAKAITDGDPEDFYFAVQYPMGRLVDTMLAQNIEECGGKNDLLFVFKNGNMIEKHVRHLIEKHEGFGCVADKSRSVVRALIRFFKTGQRMEWNYKQEYTYHLPKIAFVEHEIILQFYIGLKHLQSGNPNFYLSALLSVEQAATSRRNKADEALALEKSEKGAEPGSENCPPQSD